MGALAGGKAVTLGVGRCARHDRKRRLPAERAEQVALEVHVRVAAEVLEQVGESGGDPGSPHGRLAKQRRDRSARLAQPQVRERV